MRRSLGHALKNAYEETTMKNVSIDQILSFRWWNGVQNQNLHKNLSKIGHFGNSNFSSKSQQMSQSQKLSTHKGPWVKSEKLGSGWSRSAKSMMMCADVVTLWHGEACMAVMWLGLMWLLLTSWTISKEDWRSVSVCGWHEIAIASGWTSRGCVRACVR